MPDTESPRRALPQAVGQDRLHELTVEPGDRMKQSGRKTYYTQYDTDKGYTSTYAPSRPRENPSPTRSPRLHRKESFSNHPSSTYPRSRDSITDASRSILYTSNHSYPNQHRKRLESYADQGSSSSSSISTVYRTHEHTPSGSSDGEASSLALSYGLYGVPSTGPSTRRNTDESYGYYGVRPTTARSSDSDPPTNSWPNPVPVLRMTAIQRALEEGRQAGREIGWRETYADGWRYGQDAEMWDSVGTSDIPEEGTFNMSGRYPVPRGLSHERDI